MEGAGLYPESYNTRNEWNVLGSNADAALQVGTETDFVASRPVIVERTRLELVTSALSKQRSEPTELTFQF